MTETSTIYYHKPKIRKTNLRKEVLGAANDMIPEDTLSVKERAASFALRESLRAAASECEVPSESVFNCSANFYH